MLNQNRFRHDRRPNGIGTLEIGLPTAADASCTTVRVSEAFQRPACGLTAGGKKNLRTNQDKLETRRERSLRAILSGRIVEINI
jgi:hypothetical protein